jgi:NADH-quinone oxidoreductase subunit J
VLAAVTILQYTFRPTTESAIGADMRTIGLQLLDTQITGYALPFEVISILLLAALVGSIFIARKHDT